MGKVFGELLILIILLLLGVIISSGILFAVYFKTKKNTSILPVFITSQIICLLFGPVSSYLLFNFFNYMIKYPNSFLYFILIFICFLLHIIFSFLGAKIGTFISNPFTK